MFCLCLELQKKLKQFLTQNLLAIANTLLYSEVTFFYEGKEEFEMINAITNSKKEKVENADYIFCDELNEYLFNKGKIGTSKDPRIFIYFLFLNVKILKV